jgi:hypothetical protein
VTERTESPDGSRRAAIVGGLYRTARAVPLLWEYCTGRLAPCRFCAEQARYTARRWLWSAPTCRSFGFPWGSELRERQAEPDGSRRAAIVFGTGRLAPCRFCAEQARYTARRWLWSAPTCRSFGFPWDSERRERQAEPDGSRRAAFVGLDPWGRSSMPEDRGAGRVNAFRNRYRGVTMTRSDGSRGGAHVDGCESRF